MLKKIIGIAAPARSGKDTVASMLLKHKKVTAYALADPLKLGCQALFGLTDKETWDDCYKETIIPLWHYSPRKFFQHLGTDWMRVHNSDHWLMRAERAINSEVTTKNLTLASHSKSPKCPFKLAAQAFFGLSEAQTWDSHHSEIIDSYWEMSPTQMFDLIESLTIKDFPDYFERRSQRPISQSYRSLPSFKDSDVIIIKDIRFENEADFLRRHNGIIWHVVRNNSQKVNPHSSELGIKIREDDIVIHNNSTLEQLAITVKQNWFDFQKSQKPD